MKIEFTCIKIDGRKNRYLLKLKYDDLVKFTKIKKLSSNRDIEGKRAKEMTKYIVQEDSFYPPLIVAMSKFDKIVYSEELRKIQIEIGEDKDVFTIIDGQHRYKSIELIITENMITNIEEFKKREQSIFLIDGLDEFEQRKLFMDINNNAKKVSTGTKERFEITISNYLGLIVIDSVSGLLKNITWEENQTKTFEKIPYKFITKSNKEMLKDLENKFKKNKIKFCEIQKLSPLIISLWDKVNEFIKEITNLKYESLSKEDILTNEIFYKTLFEHLRDKFNKTISDDSIDEQQFDSISNELDSILNKLKPNFNEELRGIKGSKDDKINKLKAVIGAKNNG